MLVRPVARDDFGGALVEQIEADGAAEFAGPFAGPRRDASIKWPPVSSSTAAVNVISLPSSVACRNR